MRQDNKFKCEYLQDECQKTAINFKFPLKMFQLNEIYSNKKYLLKKIDSNHVEMRKKVKLSNSNALIKLIID